MPCALSLIPDVKNTDITATDDTANGAGSARLTMGAYEEQYGHVDSKLTATDNTGGPTSTAKGNISSVPNSHGTNVNATDNTAGATGSAKGNIRSVPNSHNTGFKGHVDGSLSSAVASANKRRVELGYRPHQGHLRGLQGWQGYWWSYQRAGYWHV